jgi:HSP20 family protein
MTKANTNESTNSSAKDTAWCVYSPDVDVYENDQELLLIADVPGTSADRITVDLAGSVLSVSALLADEGEYKASYRRQFKLAVPIDPDKISAESKAGELTIRLGKAGAHSPKHIEVRAA